MTKQVKFLYENTRNEAVDYLSNWAAEGYASDRFGQSDWFEIMRDGMKGYKEFSDLQLLQQFKYEADERSEDEEPDEELIALYNKLRAEHSEYNAINRKRS